MANEKSELMKQFQNLMGSGRGNFGLLSRHLNCPTSSLIAFYNGSEEALTVDQRIQLTQMILDLYAGKTVSGGFYLEDGRIMWSSM